MARAFTVDGPPRVVFGVGTEAQLASELRATGAERVLLVAQPHHREGAERVAAALGDRCVGIFDQVVQHVPERVAQAAIGSAEATDADSVVAHGGGSPIGVAKAIALERDVAVGAVPTTYSGSECTDIYGITGPDGKRTGRDPRVQPRLVVYDPALTTALPVDLSLQSLLNALAHSVEALWSAEVTPAARAAAEESLAPLVQGMKRIHEAPTDLDGRAEALYGAWLAGTALNGASMALHHKLAHVLGGTFHTPHATTHAILLPYVIGFNGPSAPAAIDAMRRAWGVQDPATFLSELARELGVPTSLRDLGLSRADLQTAADQAVQRRYPNPRPFDREAILGLLETAWEAPPLSRSASAGSG